MTPILSKKDLSSVFIENKWQKKENRSHGKIRKYDYNHFLKIMKLKVMRATSYQLKSFIGLTKNLHKKSSTPANFQKVILLLKKQINQKFLNRVDPKL